MVELILTAYKKTDKIIVNNSFPTFKTVNRIL